MAKIQTPAEDTYEGWAQLLGLKEEKKIGHNTYARRLSDGGIGIVYHYTAVVIFERDGSIRLNSGGYRSTTTKQRMNAVLPMSVRVFQRAYVWYVQRGGFEQGTCEEYRDMMLVQPAREER